MDTVGSIDLEMRGPTHDDRGYVGGKVGRAGRKPVVLMMDEAGAIVGSEDGKTQKLGAGMLVVVGCAYFAQTREGHVVHKYMYSIHKYYLPHPRPSLAAMKTRSRTV